MLKRKLELGHQPRLYQSPAQAERPGTVFPKAGHSQRSTEVNDHQHSAEAAHGGDFRIDSFGLNIPKKGRLQRSFLPRSESAENI